MIVETETVETETGTEQSVRKRTGVKLRGIGGAENSRKPGDSATRRDRTRRRERGESR